MLLDGKDFEEYLEPDPGFDCIEYFPPNEAKNTRDYFQTGKTDDKTNKITIECPQVDPKYLYWGWNKNFIDLCKLTRNHRKWIYLPVGKKDHEDLPPNVVKTIRIKYYQEKDEETCLFNSLASALHYFTEHKKGGQRFEELGEEIYTLGQQNRNIDFHSQFDIVTKLMFSKGKIFANNRYKTLHVKYVKKKKKKVKYKIMDPFDVTTNNITIVIPIVKNERKTHTFYIVDEYLFDSSSKYVMLKTTEAIVWCCNVK